MRIVLSTVLESGYGMRCYLNAERLKSCVEHVERVFQNTKYQAINTTIFEVYMSERNHLRSGEKNNFVFLFH